MSHFSTVVCLGGLVGGCLGGTIYGIMGKGDNNSRARNVLIGTIAGAAFVMLGTALVLANSSGAVCGMFIGVTWMLLDGFDNKGVGTQTQNDKFFIMARKIFLRITTMSLAGYLIGYLAGYRN